MRANDGKGFQNISATTAQFPLFGGRYQVNVIATFGGGSVKLQRLAADNTTWQSVATATDFTAAGLAVVELPAGSYRFTIATATAVYAGLDRIPGE